jgi:tRNA/rRNA methyltransferase
MQNTVQSDSFGQLTHVRVVLVRTTLTRNIGSTARAMKTMGIDDLVLVAPRQRPDAEAFALASGADDVLERARIVDTLPEAIGDCVSAFALSAREREWGPQRLSVREAAQAAIERTTQGPVALVFGHEASGLSNEELLTCQTHVRIDTNPAYGSLNVAQAVQIVVYEMRQAAGMSLPQAPAERAATVDDLEGLYAALEQAAARSGFLDPSQPGKLEARWRRMFSRVRLEREEVNILRGLLRALQKPRNSDHSL